MTEPIVSVVVPTFNRPRRLRDCLEGLAAQQFDRPRFEVIVVDDGSPRPLANPGERITNHLEFRIVRQARAGPGSARNAGAAVARGRYLAFIDDDCVPAPDWLARIVAALEAAPGVLVGGRVENSLRANRYADASDRISRFAYDYYRDQSAREPFFTTNNLAVDAERFRALGGFTTAIPSATAEDKEFCDRWRTRGWGLAHAPDAVVFHAHDLTFRGFLRQHYNYGRGIIAFRFIRRERAAGPLIPESFRFYLRLFASPMHEGPRGRSLVACVLVALAQVATAAGAIHQAWRWPVDGRRERRRESPAS